MLYLVTFENHDPVFSIDLSDPANPTLLGELEIPGFSDYLHPWDETHLLGIGYDTDEETSESLGIKLSMFDISDPTNVTEEAHLVFTPTKRMDDEDGYRYDEVPGLSNYRALLVDSTKNLIGFGGESYSGSWNGSDEEQKAYYLFTYKNGTFKKQMVCKEKDDSSVDLLRGVYIGNTFYVVSENRIRSFDMKDQFTEGGKLLLW